MLYGVYTRVCARMCYHCGFWSLSFTLSAHSFTERMLESQARLKAKELEAQELQHLRVPFMGRLDNQSRDTTTF